MASRDYRKSRARGGEGRPPSRWVWFLLGMFCGVLVGALPYLYPYFPQGMRTAMTQVAAKDSGESAKPPAKPRFEFYTMLPKMEVAVPDDELRSDSDRTDGASGDASGESQNVTFVLQVGSFKRPEDADRHKAELALLGFEASVQAVVIDGTNTWHRVRLGPYGRLDEVHRDRARLIESDIESMVLRIGL